MHHCRRGKLRKKSSVCEAALLQLECRELCASESESDEDTVLPNQIEFPRERLFRALVFDLSGWRSRNIDTQPMADQYTLHCSSVDIPYDTKRWLEALACDQSNTASSEIQNRDGTSLQQVDNTHIRKRKMDELLLRKRARSRNEKVVSSCTLDIIPAQLRADVSNSFESLLCAYGMPKPWNAGYVEIQRDRQPDYTDTESLSVFLNKFKFSLGVWWLTSCPATLYVTMEAEHSEGYAQCTYSVPEDRELELAILALLDTSCFV
jgi:hypothetical protein